MSIRRSAADLLLDDERSCPSLSSAPEQKEHTAL